MSSALGQTLIGAAAALIGGLGAALWQIARADRVAVRIRRAERYESALLDLNASVAVTYGRLLDIYRQAERGQNATQYIEARQAVDQLRVHWDSRSSSMIGDQATVDAYAYFNAAVQEGLPGGQATLARVQYLSAGDDGAGRMFKRDLGHVVGSLDELRKELHEQVRSLDSEPRTHNMLASLSASLRARVPTGRRH